MTLWARVWDTQIRWSTGQFLIAQLNPGTTLARVHFGIRWLGVTSNEQDFTTLADDFMAVGVVTQSSATGTTAPNALTGATDANPPTERWIWWATTQMRPIVLDTDHPGLMMWGTDVTSLIDDTKGQVAANVGAGHTLNVYITWSPWITTGWGARGNVSGSAWSSSLII